MYYRLDLHVLTSREMKELWKEWKTRFLSPCKGHLQRNTVTSYSQNERAILYIWNYPMINSLSQSEATISMNCDPIDLLLDYDYWTWQPFWIVQCVYVDHFDSHSGYMATILNSTVGIWRPFCLLPGWSRCAHKENFAAEGKFLRDSRCCHLIWVIK